MEPPSLEDAWRNSSPGGLLRRSGPLQPLLVCPPGNPAALGAVFLMSLAAGMPDRRVADEGQAEAAATKGLTGHNEQARLWAMTGCEVKAGRMRKWRGKASRAPFPTYSARAAERAKDDSAAREVKDGQAGTGTALRRTGPG